MTQLHNDLSCSGALRQAPSLWRCHEPAQYHENLNIQLRLIGMLLGTLPEYFSLSPSLEGIIKTQLINHFADHDLILF